MSERILTLFGEELVPEQPKPAPKPRARKKAEDEKAEQQTEDTPAADIEKIPEAEEINASVNEPGPEADLETKQEIFELPEDWKGDKQYYTIGEVAKLFNVKTSHIRFWTNEFKLKVRTTRKGDRLYTPAQVKELRAIHHLVKGRGFTLNGAKTKLKQQNKRDVKAVDLKDSLLMLKEKLVIIRNKLAETRHP